MRGRKRKDSPVSSTHNDQPNKQDGPESPLPEEIYVILPGHPFYGQKVRLTHYEPARRAHYCFIENPLYPGFQYQIKATWLSPTPPLSTSPEDFKQGSIWIALPALDRMVQILLIHLEQWKAREDETFIGSGNHPDLEPNPGSPPADASGAPLLPGVSTGRRHSA